MLNNFKLLYSIPQQIGDYQNWPKYGLESIYLENDTLLTLLVKTNCITAIPLSENTNVITHTTTPLPANEFPLFLKRYQNKWYTASVQSIKKIESSSQYQTIIDIPSKRCLNFFEIINNKIVYADRRVDIVLTDINGQELKRIQYNYFTLASAIYNNRIISRKNDIVIDSNSFHIDTRYICSLKYKKEDYFIGGCDKFGYFVDFDQRDHFIIRDMINMADEELVNFNHTFKAEDLDFPEEDDINIRILSEDNKTFYIIQVKNEHLDIYKGVKISMHDLPCKEKGE